MLCLWQRREGGKSVGGRHAQPLAEDWGGQQRTISQACIQDAVTVLKRVLYFIHTVLPAYIYTYIHTHTKDHLPCMHTRCCNCFEESIVFYTYILTCIHTYTHTYIHTNRQRYMHTYVQTYLYTYIAMYMLIFIHIQMFSKVCKIAKLPLEILHSQLVL